jgi:uncharacterized protein YcbK (DUF882 family)
MKRERDNQQDNFDLDSVTVSRRRLIKMGMAGVGALLVPGLALAEWVRLAPESASPLSRTVYRPPSSSSRGTASSRSLAVYNLHTDERLNVSYWERGDYIPGALREINYLFRDFRANEIKPMDPRLLDILYDLRVLTGSLSRPISLISGYRTPATNAMLAAASEGVARHSMHIEAKAADIHIDGVELSYLQRAALSLDAGGVGYYPRSNFVHVDTGRVRRWG